MATSGKTSPHISIPILATQVSIPNRLAVSQRMLGAQSNRSRLGLCSWLMGLFLFNLRNRRASFVCRGEAVGAVIEPSRPHRLTAIRSSQAIGIFMHCTQFIDLAALMARQFLRLNELGTAPAYERIQAYWLAHRYRQDHWNKELHQHQVALAEASKTVFQSRARQWHNIAPLLQEILVCEPLTRILAYGARWLSESQNCVDFELLTASVLTSHAESRNRVLHAIVFGHGMPVELAAKLNRIRRSMEDFNDYLLGLVPRTSNLDSFCFDSFEVAESQKKIESEHNLPRLLEVHLPAITIAIKHRLTYMIDPRAATPQFNRRLAEIVTAFWGTDSFDSVGRLRQEEAIWVEQLSRECDPSHPHNPAAWLPPFHQLLKSPVQNGRQPQVQNTRWQ